MAESVKVVSDIQIAENGTTDAKCHYNGVCCYPVEVMICGYVGCIYSYTNDPNTVYTDNDAISQYVSTLFA